MRDRLSPQPGQPLADQIGASCLGGPESSRDTGIHFGDQDPFIELAPSGIGTAEEPARWRLERVVRACAVASREEGEFVRRLRREKLRR
ncbi:hypothetical protein [Nocardia sp. XZ_19_369]|uniref:hypothetical protein n=1 Tax=Nocardia sp. XZ_19_369 TaxID=2769487 RepID=UPI00188FABCA|nr:hypothetical protein [Nocardia sp. XZ_19_369]